MPVLELENIMEMKNPMESAGNNNGGERGFDCGGSWFSELFGQFVGSEDWWK